jgi:hypothetical protein
MQISVGGAGRGWDKTGKAVRRPDSNFSCFLKICTGYGAFLVAHVHELGNFGSVLLFV